MIENGFKNVKTVRGGGAAMEKFFDHYGVDYTGRGKIIGPKTGEKFGVKP
jgi:hypothetical protein